MKYFLDTEFIEGFHKPLFGKRRHFIDLISIGIVCEDGREYKAISSEYNYNDSDEWVKKNVIIPLYTKTVNGDGRNIWSAKDFNIWFGKSNEQIRVEILEFTGCWRDQHFWRCSDEEIEFYGDYCDYDWVLFCSLFGRMADLPKGFPMYCRDLKQMYDYSGISIQMDDLVVNNSPHDALQDAKRNMELYNKIEKLNTNSI